LYRLLSSLELIGIASETDCQGESCCQLLINGRCASEDTEHLMVLLLASFPAHMQLPAVNCTSSSYYWFCQF